MEYQSAFKWPETLPGTAPYAQKLPLKFQNSPQEIGHPEQTLHRIYMSLTFFFFTKPLFTPNFSECVSEWEWERARTFSLCRKSVNFSRCSLSGYLFQLHHITQTTLIMAIRPSFSLCWQHYSGRRFSGLFAVPKNLELAVSGAGKKIRKWPSCGGVRLGPWIEGKFKNQKDQQQSCWWKGAI